MNAMQEPQPSSERERQLTQALREFDPDAEVRIGSDDKLSVSTVLDERDVIAILGGIGVNAAPNRSNVRDDPQDRNGCCGGCGCG